MLRDIEVDNPATVMCKDHEDEQHLVFDGGYHKEINADQIDGGPEKGQEYQGVRIFRKDRALNALFATNTRLAL